MKQAKKEKIMVIDDNITNLNIARKALEALYDVFLIPCGEKALDIISKINPDLILLDVEMPSLNGFQVITKIKEMPVPISETPVIFLTSKEDFNSEFEGLNLGAVDYITKPFPFSLLIKRVELQLKLAQQKRELLNYSINLEKMVAEKTQVITELQYSIVHVLSNMVEKRDLTTGGHLLRTSSYLKILLKKVVEEKIYIHELENIDFELYAHASQMHDVGKISIPDSILLNKGALTRPEFEIMKKHTTIGEDAIKTAMSNIQEATFLKIAAEFASTHHERWDGTGYPKGLKKEDIPLTGRLMAIVDVYDAIISKRHYKPALPHEEAVRLIIQDSGTHFDPLLISVFEKVTDQFKEISITYD